MDDLLAIAATWSPWDQPFASTVPRRVDLPSELRDSLAVVVQGVRRCGKSTLLQQMVGHYDLDPARCLFLNLEDPRLSTGLGHELLDEVVAAFVAHHEGNGPLHFFFDEVQWVDGWQRWLRVQLDRPRGHTFVVTGSSARLLSGELGSSLTGRHLPVHLDPFDLAELRALRPGTTLQDWLHLGGFPEPATLADGDRLLRQYVQDIVERDIRERIGARSSQAIRSLVQTVFEATGSELSLRRVAGALGIATDTAGVWLEACQDAYLLFACPFFAWSERKRAHRNVKYYPVDSGLRRVVVTPGGHDRGKALECATHAALRRRFGEVFYWRGQGEVDFVVLRGRTPVPVQVTWNAPQERHHRALEAFYEAHPHAAEAVFVTASSFEEELGRLGEAG